MNFGKMSKTGATMLLIVISVAILMIPPAAISTAETLTVQNIIAVQGDYVNGTDILTVPTNHSLPTNGWPIGTTLVNEVNNDAALYGYRNNGSHSTRWSIAWENMQTYIGNGTYEMDVNYSSMPSPAYNSRMIIVELDINNSEWVQYDFVKITTDYEFSSIVVYSTDATSINSLTPNTITTTIDLYINTLSTRTEQTAYPDGKVWLMFEVPESTSEDEAFNFNIEAYSLTAADSLTWTEDQMYVLTLLGCDIILIVGFIFTTNFVDIAIDRSKGKNRR